MDREMRSMTVARGSIVGFPPLRRLTACRRALDARGVGINEFDRVRAWLVANPPKGMLSTPTDAELAGAGPVEGTKMPATVAASTATAVASTLTAAGLAALPVAALPVLLPAAPAAAGLVYMRARRKSRQTSSSPDRNVARSRSMELRRVRYARRWVRDEALPHVPAGASYAEAFTLRVGASESATKDLSMLLGASGKFGLATINRQLTERLGRTITVIRQTESTKTLTLTNDRSGFDRIFAIWHLHYELEIDVLATIERRGSGEDWPVWKNLS